MGRQEDEDNVRSQQRRQFKEENATAHNRQKTGKGKTGIEEDNVRRQKRRQQQGKTKDGGIEDKLRKRTSALRREKTARTKTGIKEDNVGAKEDKETASTRLTGRGNGSHYRKSS